MDSLTKAGQALATKAGQALEEAEAKDAKDHRTLDEVKVDNDSNFLEILDKCRSQEFSSKVYAYQYRLHCIEKAFRDLGFSPQELITSCTSAEVAGELISQNMIVRGISMEDWSHHPEKDRRGAYLYKNGELAFFVALIRKRGDRYIVKTNVKFS